MLTAAVVVMMATAGPRLLLQRGKRLLRTLKVARLQILPDGRERLHERIRWRTRAVAAGRGEAERLAELGEGLSRARQVSGADRVGELKELLPGIVRICRTDAESG